MKNKKTSSRIVVDDSFCERSKIYAERWLGTIFCLRSSIDYQRYALSDGCNINPLRAKFLQREHKHVFTCCVISPH